MGGHRGLTFGASVVLGLGLLPIAGIGLSAYQPPGLVVLPSLDLARLGPVVLRSLALALCVSSLSLVLGTALAWLAEKTRYPGSVIFARLGVLPLAIPSYLLAGILREEFAPAGTLGGWLGSLDGFTGFGPCVVVLTLACTPYAQILVSAGLRAIPVSEEEAARSLGAGAGRRFWVLGVPRLRPTWAFALMLIALYVISDFGAVAVLDCRVLTWELYNARGARDAYRIALAVVACVIPLFALIRGLQGSGEPQVTLGVGRSASSPLRLRGAPLLLAYCAHAFIVGLGVIVPVLSLIRWVVLGWSAGANFAPIGPQLLVTLVCATVGAAVILAASFLPASFVQQAPRRGRWVEQGVYLTSSLPGVLVAFGILHLSLFLERRLGTALGGESLWDFLDRLGGFLLLGYVMRFLSQGYAAVRPAIGAVDRRMLEAARSLGVTRLRRLARVWLPAMAPGLSAAYLLLFISVAKELPVTLMLLPAGSQTLAYRIFDAHSEASLPDAGWAGLLLLGTVGVAQGLVTLGGRRVR